MQGSVTYARCFYRGLDGVLRPGNFDVPFSAKLSGVWSVGRGYTLSMRYDGASGRAYTPDDISESRAQGRDIYNLNQINGRAPALTAAWTCASAKVAAWAPEHSPGTSA